jgi:hypothetical protein
MSYGDPYDFKQYLDDNHVLDMQWYSGEEEDECDDEMQREFCIETIGDLLKTILKNRNTNSNTVNVQAYNLGWQAHSANKDIQVDVNASDSHAGDDFVCTTFMNRYEGISIYVKDIENLYSTVHTNGFIVVCHSHDCNQVLIISQ